MIRVRIRRTNRFRDFVGGISRCSGIAGCGGVLDGTVDVAGAAQYTFECSFRAILFVPWGSLFEPLIPMFMSILICHRDWSEWAETSNERALHVQISPVSCESNRVRRTRQEFAQRCGK